MFQKTPLPAWSVHAFGLFLPWAEAVVGFFVFIGLWTPAALVGGALLMLALTFGTALRQDWNVAGIQLIYSVIYAALLASRNWDIFSLDSLLARTRASNAMSPPASARKEPEA
jgi:thiosulfate dehydrogenase (quinone) large subunit